MIKLTAQLRWFLIAQALTYTVTVGSTVSFDQWQCGADQETRQIAYDSSRHDCPTVMDHLNKCCIVHDQCYVDQLGRYKCDDDFCQCLSDAANNASNVEQCESSTEFACISVHFFGDFAYAEAEKEGKTKALSSTTLATRVAETHKTSTAKSSTKRPKTTHAPVHKVTTTKIPVTSPSTTTKQDGRVCNVEDGVLKQWYKNTMANCPEYQDEVGDCCEDHTTCINNKPTSPMLCPTQFIECLLRKVRPLRNDRKCYETVLMMHNELASNLYKYKGLSARIQGWIGGLGDRAVDVQFAVRNTLGKDPWRKVLAMTSFFAFIWTVAYTVFFTELLEKARWKLPFKLIPEKARLIQVSSTGTM